MNITVDPPVAANPADLIHSLETQNRQLLADNKKKDETIQWMHDLIWELLQKTSSVDII